MRVLALTSKTELNNVKKYCNTLAESAVSLQGTCFENIGVKRKAMFVKTENKSVIGTRLKNITSIELIAYKKSSVDVMVASMSRPKSKSFKVALAVSRSRNVSNGDSLSSDGNAASPETTINLCRDISERSGQNIDYK